MHICTCSESKNCSLERKPLRHMGCEDQSVSADDKIPPPPPSEDTSHTEPKEWIPSQTFLHYPNFDKNLTGIYDRTFAWKQKGEARRQKKQQQAMISGLRECTFRPVVNDKIAKKTTGKEVTVQTSVLYLNWCLSSDPPVCYSLTKFPSASQEMRKRLQLANLTLTLRKLHKKVSSNFLPTISLYIIAGNP